MPAGCPTSCTVSCQGNERRAVHGEGTLVQVCPGQLCDCKPIIFKDWFPVVMANVFTPRGHRVDLPDKIENLRLNLYFRSIADGLSGPYDLGMCVTCNSGLRCMLHFPMLKYLGKGPAGCRCHFFSIYNTPDSQQHSKHEYPAPAVSVGHADQQRSLRWR